MHKKEMQLRLPFNLGMQVRQVQVRQVRARVQSARFLLAALHLKVGGVEEILIHPERHWKKVIKQREGKQRICYSPSPALRKVQKRVARYLANLRWLYKARDYFPATAFGRRCDIIANARWHRKNQSSWWLDLRDAFQSTKAKHIQRYLWHDDHFSLFRENGRDQVWVLSRLLTYRGRLRQGSPASPLVFNLLMRRFDWAVMLALDTKAFPLECDQPRAGIIYTRYGDDLCFSAPTPIFPEWAKEKVRALLAKHGLRVNEQKTREGRKGVLEFPGVLIVQGRIRPRSDYLAKLAERRARGDLRPEAVRGHLGFLNQFGHGGQLKITRFLLGETSS